jgi:hypothetical protein
VAHWRRADRRSSRGSLRGYCTWQTWQLLALADGPRCNGLAAEPIIASVRCYVGNPSRRTTDSTKVQQMAQWLDFVSWVTVSLGLLTAVAIAFDVIAHPQHMKIMNVVWPITGLYLPVAGWWLYADMARRKPMSMPMDMHAARAGRPFWKGVFVSTTHCAAGCVIGDIIGAPIVFWTGWTLFGERLYAEYVVLFILAYIFGIAFQYLPIRAVRRILPGKALLEAIKADTLALTAFEIGLFAWMALAYFVFVIRPELTSSTYWFMMQIGMVLGFIASYPPNWYLVRAGVKPGM